ncbi:MAG TPA: 1-acyl-sn-glycerol-3-phosphate acyltransferase [Gemmatimonadaceae bacterium]|nr:1-acyl-sn-glycerol-3-phosphate acyltransferase [Gemmatimonadaceae bacterium]
MPATGPVLLVANHPNSLLDPFLVTVAAQRPVRFLAKAPLFSDPLIGWGVRAVGAIPVYRRMDDPSQTGRNEETFRAVHAAMGRSSAVGIFPEGISHDHPALVPLKTGAARIALGAAAVTGGPFPIVPVGLVFEAKEIFRSAAYVVVGEPVEWDDLAGEGLDNAVAVRELTGRIDEALHDVTVNLERREDSRLIGAATAIYAAEVEEPDGPHAEAGRRIAAARALARLKQDGDADATLAAEAVRRHDTTLAMLGLSPADVHLSTGLGSALKWTIRRLAPAQMLAAAVAAGGAVIFWLPYALTRIVAERGAAPDVLATRKLLYGGAIFKVWILLLALGLGLAFGWPTGVVALLLLPLLALRTLSYGELWADSARDARSFFVRRSRARTLSELRDRQREIGHLLRELYHRAEATQGASSQAADPALGRSAARRE